MYKLNKLRLEKVDVGNDEDRYEELDLTPEKKNVVDYTNEAMV